MRPIKFLRIVVFIAVVTSCAPKENPPLQWEPYDETPVLTANENHPVKRLRYRQILSPFQDKDALMAPFYDEFKYYDVAQHQRLAPLILEQDIATLQAHIAAGKLSYEALTLFYLYRIYTAELDHNRFLNAVLQINPNVLEEAKAKDKAYKKGGSFPPLFGMPILVKDNINTVGTATTAGALAFADNRTEEDAFIIHQLKNQGALILGKANLSEWAYFFCKGCPVGYSAMGGQTLNPYGRMQLETGGSSSGSGVAVAANYAVAAIGSETSGSILSPSGKNAVVGLKPTIGALSRSGIIPISASLDTPGPMTKNVRDNALLYNAMLGADPKDAASYAAEKIAVDALNQATLEGKTLAYIEDFNDNPLYAQALKDLEAAGATLVAFTPNSQRLENFGVRLAAEMKRDLPVYVKQFAAAKLPFSSVAAVAAFNDEALDTRAPYGQGNFDAIVENTTTAEELATIVAEMTQKGRHYFAPAFSDAKADAVLSINNYNAGVAAVAYYPALTVPMGFKDNGAPQNLTFIAPSRQEQQLYRLAAAYEKLTHHRTPPKEHPHAHEKQ